MDISWDFVVLWDSWIDRSKNPRSDWPSMDEIKVTVQNLKSPDDTPPTLCGRYMIDNQDKGLASLRCKTWGVWSQELSANLEITSGYDVVLFGFISIFPESVWAQGSSNSGGSVSHLLIFTPSHLHIFSSSHLLIFTSAHLHIFSHICSSSHLLSFLSPFFSLSPSLSFSL